MSSRLGGRIIMMEQLSKRSLTSCATIDRASFPLRINHYSPSTAFAVAHEFGCGTRDSFPQRATVICVCCTTAFGSNPDIATSTNDRL